MTQNRRFRLPEGRPNEVPRGVSPEEVAMKYRIDELYTK